MKTKAAIAYAAGKPLEVVTVELGGPKAGEVLVEIHASGVCHTDEFTRSGADPEGLFITHVMPLEKINDAFDLMHKGESIRSVVTF
jgi:Zn-dependent alcohol dehydrogenase